MEAESFFARWSKRNAEAAAEKRAEESTPLPAAGEEAEPNRPPPSLEDVALLTPDSDFKPFVARGVDEQVRRSALKKLFADPRFNVMDGMDVYIEDYNKYTPIPPAMLAALNHAQALLNPLAHLENPLMALLDAVQEDDTPSPAPADGSDSTTASLDTPEHDTPPPAQEQTSHDDPVQGM